MLLTVILRALLKVKTPDNNGIITILFNHYSVKTHLEYSLEAPKRSISGEYTFFFW